MSSTKGRKPGSVRSFVTTQDTDSAGRILYSCTAPGCYHTRRTKDLPSAKWADHIALECEFTDDATKVSVVREHKTKRPAAAFKSVSNTMGPMTQREYCVRHKCMI